MLARQDDYLPEAMDAAREELRRRNLPAEKGAQLEAVVRMQKEAEDAKANIRLGWPMRILIFFLLAGIVGVVLAMYYQGKGFKRKASDCWATTAISLLAHIFFVAVSSMFLLK